MIISLNAVRHITASDVFVFSVISGYLSDLRAGSIAAAPVSPVYTSGNRITTGHQAALIPS